MLVDPVALRQQFVQFRLSDRAAQRGLRDQGGGAGIVFDVQDRLRGSTTLNSTMASTVTGTLSRVIISWRGTSSVTMRVSTR